MFAFVAKKAPTSLKRPVYTFDSPGRERLSNTEEIHEFVNYSFVGKTHMPLTDADQTCNAEYAKFAVYRDSVERFILISYEKDGPERSPDN